MKKLSIDPNIMANSFARKNGHSIATCITIGDNFKLINNTPYGYRKFTTGEYVPNKYRQNFGWKNTYYQCAKCHISIPVDIYSAWENDCRHRQIDS